MVRSPGNDLELGPIVNGQGTLRLSRDQRSTHLHVVGNTGSGKTKFLESLIRQDVLANRTSGCGMLVIDPHGSLYTNIMRWLARHGIDRPITPINLRDEQWTVSHNLLRKRKSASASVVVDSITDAMAHAWGAANTDQTPRLARWSGNVLHVLYEKGYTLADAVHLLTNQVETREAMTTGLSDDIARSDWDRVRAYKPREFDDEVSSTVNRLRRFVSNKHMRAIFGQPDRSFDFDAALEEGHIVLVNLGTTSVASVIVSETFYDSGGTATTGIGNGTVGLSRQRLDDSGSNRDTKYTYDDRDRLLRIEPPLKPNTLMVYDNLDRVVEEAVFDDLPSPTENLAAADANRGRFATTSYSQRGQVYKQSVAIDPTLASGSRTYLETHTWFDEVGRAVGAWVPNAPMTKSAFDGLGRMKTVYATDRGGDDAPGASGNYADVYDTSTHTSVVTGDVVFEESAYNYVAAGTAKGLADRVTTRQRIHRGINLGSALISDSDTGALSALASNKSIATYHGTFYDAADRVRHSVDYGTNSTSGFISGTSAPTITQGSPPSGDELVSETIYDNRGRLETIDPEGAKTKFQYDDMDRRIAVIENYDNGSVSWNTTPALDRWGASGLSTSSLDQDRITSFVYDGASNVTQQVAHIPASGGSGETVQVTRYVYRVPKGTGAADSDLASNDLLYTVHYPNESSGEADTGAAYTVTYAYNRQGELKYMKDQNLTVHEYTRDNIGRVTVDKATRDAGNSELDNAVTALGTTYDDYGRVVLSRSYSTYSGGSPDSNVLNAVKFTYTKLWQIEKVWQEHSGNVDDDGSGSDSYKAQYVYTNGAVGSGNYSRVTSLTYPGTESLPYVYGAGSSSDDRISRLTKLDLSGQPVGYDYIGMGMTAIVDYETPNIQLDRFRTHIGETNSSPTTYPGFDRFGRIARHMWVDDDFSPGGASDPPTHSNRPPIDERTYTYDRASNRLTAKNVNVALGGWTNRDFTYTYDGLDRLAQADRGIAGGSLAGGSTAFTPSQKWSLDMLGNWKSLIVDQNGNGTDGLSPDTTDARTHNQANELVSQDIVTTGTDKLDFTYDNAGNARTQEVGSESAPTVITYTHDLWNRLVKVQYTPNGGSAATRAEYTYNALNWRIMKRADTNPSVSTALDQERKMYYSANWQLLEERIDDDYQSSAGVNRRFQYIWGPRYIDDIVLRRLDGTADGDFTDGSDKVYYHCTDVQFSTVAVVSDTAILLERVSYDPYGRARHHRPADMTGDGAVDTPDLNVVSANYGSVPAPGDVDRDGDVDGDDYIAVTLGWGTGIASGQLSLTDNVIGWDGYVFNPEIDGDGMYTVRHRHYRPELGRWMERDLRGYTDGALLYEYVRGSPVLTTDPSGLTCSGCQTTFNDASWELPVVPIVWPSGWTPLRNEPTSYDELRSCCQKALLRGFGTDADAHVTCCRGKIIICIERTARENWPAPSGVQPNTLPARQQGWYLVDMCLLQHEREHTIGRSCEWVPDGAPPLPYNSPFDPIANLLECRTHCEIYEHQIACLERAKAQCASSGILSYVCENVIDAEILALRRWMKDNGCDKLLQ
jgi:RHS repeat-associated protein